MRKCCSNLSFCTISKILNRFSFQPDCVKVGILNQYSQSYKKYKIMPFYAVAKGKEPGVFSTWSECQEQIVGFKGAVYKKFPTEEEAEQFVQERGSNIIDKRSISKANVPVTKETESKTPYKKEVIENGRISPTLLVMKKAMKDLQKELSCLRGRFDEYINSKTYSPDESSCTSSKRKAEDSVTTKAIKKTKLIDISSDNKDDKSKFTVDEDGFLVVYTDGACEMNGRNGARAGVGVYFGPDHPMNVSEPVKGRATNNTAEIQAGTHALELTKAAGFDKVIINTDSQFMINCITSWLPNWKKNNWRKKDGSEVINKEDLIDLDNASEGLLIKWNHVKGHGGIHGNEAADKLARDGAKNYVPPEKS